MPVMSKVLYMVPESVPRQKRGGITGPPRPLDADLKRMETASGPIFTWSSPDTTSFLSVQGGPFNSFWIRLHGNVDWASLLMVMRILASLTGERSLAKRESADLSIEGASCLLPDGALNFLESLNNCAMFVALQESHAASMILIPDLVGQGFKMHHAVPAEAGETGGELVYYHWLGKGVDMVPTYATSTGGIGVLIMNKEKTKTLLVHERGRWKTVTGAIDLGETEGATLVREVREEVSVSLIEETIVFLGGWSIGGHWDQLINDHMSGFAAVAESEDFQVDNKEIRNAQWFDVESILAKADVESYQGASPAFDAWPCVEGVDSPVDPKACLWLWNYMNNRYLKCTADANDGRFYYN